MITHARLLELVSYDADTGLFTRRIYNGGRALAGQILGTKKAGAYIRIKLDGQRYQAHRLAWFYTHGKWPLMVDHKYGEKDNNRLNAIRPTNHSENKQNTRNPRSDNATGFLGVHRVRDKFQARIVPYLRAKSKNLGLYATAEEAYEAYLLAKRQLHPGCTL